MHNDGLPNPFSFKYVFIFPILLLSFLPTSDAMRKEWARWADLRGFSSAWASPWAIERQMQKQYISAEVTAWGWYRKDQIPQPSRPQHTGGCCDGRELARWSWWLRRWPWNSALSLAFLSCPVPPPQSSVTPRTQERTSTCPYREGHWKMKWESEGSTFLQKPEDSETHSPRPGLQPMD